MCPRQDEEINLDTRLGLARIINPWAFATDQQIEIESVCRTGDPVEQKVMRARMKYEAAQRVALEAADRLLRCRDLIN